MKSSQPTTDLESRSLFPDYKSRSDHDNPQKKRLIQYARLFIPEFTGLELGCVNPTYTPAHRFRS